MGTPFFGRKKFIDAIFGDEENWTNGDALFWAKKIYWYNFWSGIIGNGEKLY